MLNILIFILVTEFLGILIYKNKYLFALVSIILNSLITSYFAISALNGQFFLVNNLFHLDSLSGWFILIINLVFLTGTIYGFSYVRKETLDQKKIGIHSFSLLILYFSLILLVIVQNFIIFLFLWEIMTISSVLLIILNNEKRSVIKSSINFLIQSHISFFFLLLTFMYLSIKSNDTNFLGFSEYFLRSNNLLEKVLIFIGILFGFGIKSGLVPLHTWLPYAHPAAPAHISGIMSGVLIKIGIYGIFRFTLSMFSSLDISGYIILSLGIISSVYGVMLALIQHNLKKLLAYHSIENIGIIVIGIGLGCIGQSIHSNILILLGYSGGLLHTLNHAIFKSLLFYSSGNIYQATHTLNIDLLGSLLKRMPYTGIFFLIASIAISGLPPLNGFVSEFLLYAALFGSLKQGSLVLIFFVIGGIIGLVLTGGLALYCFTKSFGIIFLGNERKKIQFNNVENSLFRLVPMSVLTILIFIIGLFPNFFLNIVSNVIDNSYHINSSTELDYFLNVLRNISYISFIFLFLVTLLYFIKFINNKNKIIEYKETWACGFKGDTSKLQYSASSFVNPFIELFKKILLIFKKEKPINGVFPSRSFLHTNPYDYIERYLVDFPINFIRSFLGNLRFFQNGKIQFYVLYGILFIIILLIIAFIKL